MKRERATAEQERDALKTKLSAAEERATKAEKERDTANETVLKTQVDALLEAAYREGKLRRGRDDEGKALASPKETRLRRIAKEDGIEGVRVELAEMDVVVPVGERVLTDKTPEPKRARPLRDADPAERHQPALADGDDDILAEVAQQLGLDDMPRYSPKEV